MPPCCLTTGTQWTPFATLNFTHVGWRVWFRQASKPTSQSCSCTTTTQTTSTTTQTSTKGEHLNNADVGGGTEEGPSAVVDAGSCLYKCADGSTLDCVSGQTVGGICEATCEQPKLEHLSGEGEQCAAIKPCGECSPSCADGYSYVGRFFCISTKQMLKQRYKLRKDFATF
jgi:hypothetical protein